MAFHSEVTPPIGGEAYKDTIDGETKRQSSDTEEDVEIVDLEEGEILDSGAESGEESNTEMPANNQNESNEAEEAVAKKVNEIFMIAKSSSVSHDEASQEYSEKKGRRKPNFNQKKYLQGKKKYYDHDHISDEEDSNDINGQSNWYQRKTAKTSSPAPSPVDYRKELGVSPPSSPERKKSDKKRSVRKKSKLYKRKRKPTEAKRRYQKYAPCKYFMEGHCSKGSDCPFSHTIGAPRPKREILAKRELCRYYLNGFCSKGRQCTFMHDEFPCKFFHTGVECYSGENCRFSHTPLTEETKKLLHECLRGYNRNEEEPRKRRCSMSPERPPKNNCNNVPPAKRPCLLGSPPRHIREGEETKKWQEEMVQLQMKNNMHMFQIQIDPEAPVASNNASNRSINFYVDTMGSPVKGPPPQQQQELLPMMMMMGNRPAPPFLPPMVSNNPILDKNEDVDWKKLQSLVEEISGPSTSSETQVNFHDCDDRRPYPQDAMPNKEQNIPPVGFYSQPNRMMNNNERLQNSPSYQFIPPVSKPSSVAPAADPPSNSPSHSPPLDCSGSSQETCDDQPPIEVPSHLPKMQQKLFMRIQKHQKVKSADSDDGAQENPEKAEAENLTTSAEPISEKEETFIPSAKQEWLSSTDDDDDDDDDEDTDKPITDVLKKLRQAPPPKLKEVPSPKPNIDLSEMLSSIMQKAKNNLPNKKQSAKQDSFWQNVLLGTIPPAIVHSDSDDTSAESSAAPGIHDSQRHALLPNPNPKKVEKSNVRDPRLKNRDPRTVAQAANKPKPVANPVQNCNPPIQPIEQTLPLLSNHHNPHRDVKSVIPNQAPAVIVDGLKEIVPYKLHSVSIRPLNYTFYLQASHSDPKLQLDPRLQRHFPPNLRKDSKENSIKNVTDTTTPITLPELPLFTQMKLEKTESTLLTRTTESTVSSSVSGPLSPDHKLPKSNHADPRSKHVEIRRLSGNITPPHPPISDPAWALPSVNPSPASHLPRAIADPRMAKLHHTIDPRRSRSVPEPISRQNSLGKTLSSSPQDSPNADSSKSEEPNEDNTKKSAVEPIKKKETSNKKKAIQRNRKSSMDYASPLNSVNESNSVSNLKYNSYNKRRKKTAIVNELAEKAAPQNEIVPLDPITGLNLLPDFNGGLTLGCDSNDSASLKDMFKTIDPTASPFC